MKVPLGHSVVGDILPRICAAAKLSKRYTNHCMRTTSGTLLKKSGFDDRVVCRLTGHKNFKSLDSYSRPSEEQRQTMAKALDCLPTSSATSRSAQPKADPDSSSAGQAIAASGNMVTSVSQGRIIVSGRGAVFNNITLNVGQMRRFSLKLKKK